MFLSFNSCKIKPRKMSWYRKKLLMFLSFNSSKIKSRKMSGRIFYRKKKRFSVSLHAILSLAKQAREFFYTQKKLTNFLSFSSCKRKPFLIHDFWVHKWTVSMLKPAYWVEFVWWYCKVALCCTLWSVVCQQNAALHLKPNRTRLEHPSSYPLLTPMTSQWWGVVQNYFAEGPSPWTVCMYWSQNHCSKMPLNQQVGNGLQWFSLKNLKSVT